MTVNEPMFQVTRSISGIILSNFEHLVRRPLELRGIRSGRFSARHTSLIYFLTMLVGLGGSWPQVDPYENLMTLWM